MTEKHEKARRAKRPRSEGEAASSGRRKGKKKKLPGLLLAISAKKQSNDANGVLQLSYEDVKRAVDASNDALAPTVHRRVSYLVAAPSALEGIGSGRVRKAIKLHIPIVTPQFVLDAKRDQPLSSYLVDTTSIRVALAFHESAKARAVANGEDVADAIEPKRVELGCCCSCHDVEGVNSCEWCDSHH